MYLFQAALYGKVSIKQGDSKERKVFIKRGPIVASIKQKPYTKNYTSINSPSN